MQFCRETGFLCSGTTLFFFFFLVLFSYFTCFCWKREENKQKFNFFFFKEKYFFYEIKKKIKCFHWLLWMVWFSRFQKTFSILLNCHNFYRVEPGKSNFSSVPWWICQYGYHYFSLFDRSNWHVTFCPGKPQLPQRTTTWWDVKLHSTC